MVYFNCMSDDKPPPKVIRFEDALKKHKKAHPKRPAKSRLDDDAWWEEGHRLWPDRFPSREDAERAVGEFMEWETKKHPVLKKWRNRKVFSEPLWADLKMRSGEAPVELLRLDADKPAHFKRFFPVNEQIPAGCELILSGFPPTEGLIEEEMEALFDPKSKPAQRRHMYNFFKISGGVDPIRDIHEFTDSLDLGRGRKIDVRITAKSHKGIKHDAEGEYTGTITDGYEIELTHTPALVKGKGTKDKGTGR